MLIKSRYLSVALLVAASALAPAAGASAATFNGVVIPPGNIIANPSFEQPGLTGWQSFNSNLSRVALSGAPDGSYVGKSSVTNGTNWYSMDYNPALTATTAGKVYNAAAYVKAASTSAVGKPLSFSVREKNSGGSTVKESAATISLGASFQKVSVTATVQNAGDTLDEYLLQAGAVTGDSFYADVVTLSAVTGTVVPPRPSTPLPAISDTTSPGGFYTGDTLSTTNGTWTGTAATYTYARQLCSPTCAPISGATSQNYGPIPSGDVGDTVEVTVTATNSAGSATETSAQTIAIRASSGGSATVSPTPLGASAPSGGWRVEYADAFGAQSKYNGGTDNTYWPNGWIGDTGTEAGSNSNEMEVYNPAKVTVDSNGLRLDCTYTGASPKPYTCGAVNIGIGGNGKPLTNPGYKFFSFQPGAGDEWALQITTQFPPTTGEADPGFWSSDEPWHYEWDMFEGWGFWTGASNWCGDAVTDPTWLSGGRIQSQGWDYPCSKWGFDPSASSHTYTTVMTSTNDFKEYIDGKLIQTMTCGCTGSPDQGGIWLTFALRNIFNNGASFRSGTRSWHIRSVAVYENASANNAHTTNGGLVAPGTQVK